MNVKRKSLVTFDGLIILIKAITTGIGSQHCYTYKAFLRKFAKKDGNILFSKKRNYFI